MLVCRTAIKIDLFCVKMQNVLIDCICKSLFTKIINFSKATENCFVCPCNGGAMDIGAKIPFLGVGGAIDEKCAAR